MKERWWLDLVPMFARTWPGVRGYYWQQEEMEQIEEDAQRMRALFEAPQEEPRRG